MCVCLGNHLKGLVGGFNPHGRTQSTGRLENDNKTTETQMGKMAQFSGVSTKKPTLNNCDLVNHGISPMGWLEPTVTKTIMVNNG